MDLYISFDTSEDLQKIIAVLNKHNKYARSNEFIRYLPADKFQELTPGPPIEIAHIRQVSRSKRYRSHANGPVLDYVLVCVDIGDVDATFHYLSWQLCRTFPSKHEIGVYKKSVNENKLLTKTAFYEDIHSELCDRFTSNTPANVVYITRREVILQNGNDSKEKKVVYMFDERHSG